MPGAMRSNELRGNLQIGNGFASSLRTILAMTRSDLIPHHIPQHKARPARAADAVAESSASGRVSAPMRTW